MFKLSSIGGATHATRGATRGVGDLLSSMTAIMQNAPRAMILTDTRATLLAWNRFAQQALPGIERSPVLDGFRPWIRQAANSDAPITVERSPVGELIGWRVSDDMVMLQQSRDAELAARLAELEEQQKYLEQEAEKLRLRAQNDHLTGLLNASSFAEYCSAKVTARRPGVLLYLDLNDFKPVNDQFGHSAGDHVLREVADRLRKILRDGDLVARLGGDEFGIWLDAQTHKAIDGLVKRVQDEIARPIFWRDNGVVQLLQVRCSVGVAESDGSATEFTGLLSLADAAMYADKRLQARSRRGSVAGRTRDGGDDGALAGR